ncbi:helix-turn-helix transcriptional regulator [Streptomyces broussonetiae]|uniref:helix-turn-helix transcriptional regulator n=1 Tax=Streptomyces broussonetiae TaxID=2686304 RepID=UPI0035D574E1
MTIYDLPLTSQPDECDPVRTARWLADGSARDVFCYWNRPLLDDPVLRALGAEGRNKYLRIAFPQSCAPRALSAYTDWQHSGAQVRQSHRLPPGALILTARGALLTTRSHAGLTWARTEDPGTLAALRTLAQMLWQQAEPLAQRQVVPSESEQQILITLLQGLTDQAIARRLNTSDRTVRRMVAQLMERLGAQSRFEAGVRAVERRWI